MSEDTLRLGDLIDDFCPRCKLLLNHAVASMMHGQVVKVICKTCYSEHAYRRGDGAKKPASSRTTLFDQVLAKTAPSAAADPPTTPVAKGERKRTAAPARYISRHKTGAPRKKSYRRVTASLAPAASPHDKRGRGYPRLSTQTSFADFTS